MLSRLWVRLKGTRLCETKADLCPSLLVALGAKAVLIGRPWVYGLGIAGKEGARDVLKGILADLDQSMGLAGTLFLHNLPSLRSSRQDIGLRGSPGSRLRLEQACLEAKACALLAYRIPSLEWYKQS